MSIIYKAQAIASCPAMDLENTRATSQRVDRNLYRWAIVCLYSSKKPGKIKRRNDMLASAIKPYSMSHNISIIFFSEDYIGEMDVLEWERSFQGIATVRTIDTSRNGFNLPERYGYKYMCKFFMLDIYSYLRNDYDFYLRCDPDCYINYMGTDIFAWAEQNSIDYGWVLRKLESHKPTVSTLPRWVDQFTKVCEISPKCPMGHPMSTCFHFYNNFHLARVNFFERTDVRRFLIAINDSSFLQTHRWGDSDLQAYAVRLFIDEGSLKMIPDIEYVHGSHKNRRISTFGDGSNTTVPNRLPNIALDC
jgi:hypothetical protein